MKGGENMNKKLLLVLGAITIIGVGVLGSSQAFAQESIAQNPVNSLVQKIADKFGLNRDDVQAVFTEHKSEMKANMSARQEDRLSKLVSEGKITEAQKTLIINKQKELTEKRAANRDSLKDLSREEIRSKMEAERAELEKWATDNGIDIKYLMGPFGRGFHMGFRPGINADN